VFDMIWRLFFKLLKKIKICPKNRKEFNGNENGMFLFLISFDFEINYR
jgi:hypothetical protein